ncbi:solute carrier family 23 member 1-like [Amphibalanus amphitrite]|uniref:solute carrier family 23 member 1-like n=1 Tax=Amphibalanus amphitrite TaxID=1232801 RepID=UPI001C90B4CF|nr:solute carrier family 23 member 1-like [Amphibalanus amphitrite]XP_043215565.1 solute carrier family 23 member 1-like [Amphibalanus amphitrite]XP_043215566.1 solute carrier family 23 member 1-like [Amphibalanus amphitrite]
MDNAALDITEDELPAKPTNGSHHHGDASIELRQRVAADGPAAAGGAGPKDDDYVPRPEMLYEVDDTPPWYYCIVLGFQQYLTMFGSTVSIPLIVTPAMCMEESDPARGYVIGTILFVSGIVTLLQVTFGVRLSIVQGGNFSFLTPTFTLLSLPEWKCPNPDAMALLSDDEKQELWMSRMREVQGAIAVSSLFQIILSFGGVVGLLLNIITPLTIAPTISMVGLALFGVAKDKAATHWGISILTMAIVILCSQYLRDFNILIPRCRRGADATQSRWMRVPVFKLFPILFGIGVSWLLCAILTYHDVLPADSPARTDLRISALREAAWFRLPYPGQWGVPSVHIGPVLGMLAGVIASMIESIGDYYACAKISGAPPPPVHAINRGIGMEGLGCCLAGLFGTGNGTTSYSENIGAIGITKVASRRVLQWGALIMMVFGTIGKFGALFITLPDPIVGGMFIIMFSMITAVGLSSLQFVNLNSSRNLFVLGFSIFFALVLPTYMSENKDVIKTGSAAFDQILYVLLSTSMFVAGFLGCVLDNTIPGTDEERGVLKWKSQSNMSHVTVSVTTYDLPFGMDKIRSWNWARYVPISPTFRGFPVVLNFSKPFRRCRGSEAGDEDERP